MHSHDVCSLPTLPVIPPGLICQITWAKPHILLLDEPSNHLDIDAVDALIKGLTLFQVTTSFLTIGSLL